MSRREPEIFGPGKCAADCVMLWEKFCRSCCLVFCASHADRAKHLCRPDEVRPYPPKNGKVPAALLPVPLSGPDLFVKPLPNGVASAPETH